MKLIFLNSLSDNELGPLEPNEKYFFQKYEKLLPFGLFAYSVCPESCVTM